MNGTHSITILSCHLAEPEMRLPFPFLHFILKRAEWIRLPSQGSLFFWPVFLHFLAVHCWLLGRGPDASSPHPRLRLATPHGEISFPCVVLNSFFFFLLLIHFRVPSHRRKAKEINTWAPNLFSFPLCARQGRNGRRRRRTQWRRLERKKPRLDQLFNLNIPVHFYYFSKSL